MHVKRIPIVFCFDLRGSASEYFHIYHAWANIRAWLLSLGATETRYDGYMQLPETIQYLADVRAFVTRGLATPLGAAVRRHLHSTMFGARHVSSDGVAFVDFEDMLTEAEWRAFEAEERRLATAQVAHAHELPCELAEMIARYVI